MRKRNAGNRALFADVFASRACYSTTARDERAHRYSQSRVGVWISGNDVGLCVADFP